MNAPLLTAYLSPREVASLCKLAEGDKTAPGVFKHMLVGAAGMGLGTLAGAASAMGVNKIYKNLEGKGIPPQYLLAAAPVIGAGMGLAYNMGQAHQLQEMRRAAQGPDHKP